MWYYVMVRDLGPGPGQDPVTQTFAKFCFHFSSPDPCLSQTSKMNLKLSFVLLNYQSIIKSVISIDVESSYVFQGTIFSNGSLPTVYTNITDEQVVNNLTETLTNYGQEINMDLSTSGITIYTIVITI